MRKLALPLFATAAVVSATAGQASATVPVGPGSPLGVCSVAATGYVNDQPVALTAGHCTLGVFGEIHLPGVDWALIPLPGNVRLHNVLPSGERLTDLGGDAVCRWGQLSRTRCDGYTGILPGDSGGPVYQPHGDGTASLVGVTSSNVQYSSLPTNFELA
jgi:hypothetical protein